MLSDAVQALLLPGRSGDLADVAADLAGVAVVAVAARRWQGRVSGAERASWRDERAGSGGPGAES